MPRKPYLWYAAALTGADPKGLDQISKNDMQAGDCGIVMTSSAVYTYYANSSATGATDSSNYTTICPTDETGGATAGFRWQLKNANYQNGSATYPTGSSITIETIKALNSSGLQLYDDGSSGGLLVADGGMLKHSMNGLGSVRTYSCGMTIADDEAVDLGAYWYGFVDAFMTYSSSGNYQYARWAICGDNTVVALDHGGVPSDEHAEADTDAKFCCYLSGSNIYVKNRMGTDGWITIKYNAMGEY